MTALGIDPTDLQTLFTLLDNGTDEGGDGKISINEFVEGSSRIRGQATSLDIAHLLCYAKKMDGQLRKVLMNVNDVGSTIPLTFSKRNGNADWKPPRSPAVAGQRTCDV